MKNVQAVRYINKHTNEKNNNKRLTRRFKKGRDEAKEAVEEEEGKDFCFF